VVRPLQERVKSERAVLMFRRRKPIEDKKQADSKKPDLNWLKRYWRQNTNKTKWLNYCGRDVWP
jgi:hypothetical protein